MSAPSKERMRTLAKFLRSQIALADRPPVGRVELNNEEAYACVLALEALVADDAPDALRYRYLRQPNHAIVYARDPHAWGRDTPGHVRYDTPEQLDEAIDKAMKCA
jgi:hypothetical protein